MAVTWGTKTTLGSQTAINDATEEFLPSAGGGVALSGAILAHVQLQVDNESGAVTNGVLVRVYTTQDDSTEDWDEHPFMEFEVVPDTINAEDISFVVSGVYKFRIGLLASAVTDDYTVGGDYRLRLT
jgi:hypothetical protein